MINFRYHLVSLAAVFLALTVGAVFGSAAANGPASDGLVASLDSAHRTNTQLRQTTVDLQQEADRKDDYIDATAPAVLRGTLAGRRIAVVTTPSAPDQGRGVVEKLRLAGATVSARVELRESFVDPANAMQLLALAHRTAGSTPLPTGGDGVQATGALLGAVLLRPAPPADGAAGTAATVLSEYSRAGYLAVPQRFTGPAEAVVLVTGDAYVERNPDERNRAVRTLAEQLGAAGRLVVAGTGAGDGTAVAAVRDDEELAGRISTVDGVAGAQGSVVTALALGERLAADRTGHYGTAAGAKAPTPR